MDLALLAVENDYVFDTVPKVDRRPEHEIFIFVTRAHNLDDGFGELVNEAFKLFWPLAPDADIWPLDRAVGEDDIDVCDVMAAAAPVDRLVCVEGGLDTVNQPLVGDAWVGLPGYSSIGQLKFQAHFFAQSEELSQLDLVHAVPELLGDHSSL